MADSVETLGVDLRTRVRRLGVKRKSEKSEVYGQILAHQEEYNLSKELHEAGGQEVAASGYGASKDVESARGRVGLQKD